MSSPAAASGPPAVLFSAGLDSAVLLAWALDRHRSAHPVYIRAGMAWEAGEHGFAARLLAAPPFTGRSAPLVTLAVDMRDVYPATHWAIRGEAPGFDTPDADVYIEGRNVVLLAKAAVYMARAGIGRVLLGPLAGNPFPDATPGFFAAMSDALTRGLGAAITIDAPFTAMHKADVIRLGRDLGVPFEHTLSCMQPVRDLHCGRCSKCRERRDGFREAGVTDPTGYAEVPRR